MTKKGIWIYCLLLFGGLAIVWGVMLVQKNNENQALAFAEPLYSHALPTGAELVTKEAKKDDASVMTAALLLACDTDENTLLAFYSDVDYPPFQEGQRTALSVKPLDEGSLDALRQAGVYREGQGYWFVYLTSTS